MMQTTPCELRVRKLFGIAAASLLIGGGGPVSGQCEEARLAPSNPVEYDATGSAVALSGKRAFVGTSDGCAPFFYDGSVSIYGFDGLTWALETVLQVPDDIGTNNFGNALASSGNVLVVGAADFIGFYYSSAYVFRYDGSNWLRETQLLRTPGFPWDRFGASVAVSGNILIVGAPNDLTQDYTWSGSAYVYRFDGREWIEEINLIASDGEANDRFGNSVSTSGDVAVISAYLDDDKGESAGAVYVFRYNSDTSQWIEETKLHASDGEQGGFFGRSVGVDGNLIVVGASEDSENGPGAGAAYVFRFDQQQSLWIEETKLLAPDGQESDLFGSSVAIENDRIVVGAPRDSDPGMRVGSTHIFEFDRAAKMWTHQMKIVASDGQDYDQLGTSVAVSGDRIIAGAPLIDYVKVNGPGSAYIFDVVDPAGLDCNDNEICDMNDILDGTSEDCNDNRVPDECESSADGDADGVKDICDNCPDLFNPDQVDCDGDGIGDLCALADGLNVDCNRNGVPDNCDILDDTSADCNGNGTPDSCDLAEATSEDCNRNQIPDVCDLDEPYLLDDGSAEFRSNVGSRDIIQLNHYIVQPGAETIGAISLVWPENLPADLPATLLLYDDPDNDGDPTDGQLLRLIPILTTSTPEEDRLRVVPIPRTFVGNPGESFFVGAHVAYNDGWEVTADSNSQYQNASWEVRTLPGQEDFENLANNDSPPQPFHEAHQYFEANWLLRASAWEDLGCACIADVDADGTVGPLDLLALLAAWGPNPGHPADIDGDRNVGVSDLLALLAIWGPCP